MDGERFDGIAKRVAVGPASRRGVLRLLVGAALGGLLARVAPAAAKPRRDDEPGVAAAAKPGGKGCQKVGRKCSKESRRCCNGARCAGGRCQCQAGFRRVGQACLPLGVCVSDAECGAAPGTVCRNGACVCADGTKACGDACIDVDRCCDDDDCRGDEICLDGSCRCQVGQKECAGNRCLDRDLCCEEGDCRCPDNLKACGDRCIARDACCVDADCGEKVCQDGTCLCRDGTADVDGRCAATCDFSGPNTCDPDLCTCRGTFPVGEAVDVCVVNDIVPNPVDDFCGLQACQSTAQCRDDEVCILTVSCGQEPLDPEGRCARVCPGPGTSARRPAGRRGRR